VEVEVGGRNITFTTGRLAKIADGAVDVQIGHTSVLVTAVSSLDRMGHDFMPLRVDYREKASAVGRIPGTFFRREMRPGDREVVISRAIGKI
jgi:polyribonucleotide nucleotidyltransferase